MILISAIHFSTRKLHNDLDWDLSTAEDISLAYHLFLYIPGTTTSSRMLSIILPFKLYIEIFKSVIFEILYSIFITGLNGLGYVFNKIKFSGTKFSDKFNQLKFSKPIHPCSIAGYCIPIFVIIFEL